MARGELIQRQWNLLKMLQTRGEGIPLRDLADEFGVSERTVQRDFEVLQELGFPIEHEDDEYGKRFWRMPHDFFRSGPLVLSLTEAVSLHLAERLVTPLAGIRCFCPSASAPISTIKQAFLLTGGRASFEVFLEHCEEVSAVGRVDALAVVTMMTGWIEQRAAEGQEVDFGPLGQTRLGLAGVFEPGEESIRPDAWRLTLGWRVARRLQQRMHQQAQVRWPRPPPATELRSARHLGGGPDERRCEPLHARRPAGAADLAGCQP